MGKTIKELDTEIDGLAKSLPQLMASSDKYGGNLKKLGTAAESLDKTLDAEVAAIQAKAKKEEEDARKVHQTKLRALANQSKGEMVQIQADSKLCRMSAERLSKIITELKAASGEEKVRKAAEAAAEKARKGYSTLSGEIGLLEAMVRKVEAACRA